MKEIIFIAAILVIFAFGFYLTRCLDIFLEENYKNTLIDIDKKEPSQVVLTGNLTDDEIIEEIHHFRENHKNIEIYLREDSTVDLT